MAAGAQSSTGRDSSLLLGGAAAAGSIGGGPRTQVRSYSLLAKEMERSSNLLTDRVYNSMIKNQKNI